jgi:hypothetical protein
VDHVLELLPHQSEEQDPHTSPLFMRGAIEEKSPVRPGEGQSSGLWLTVIRPPGRHGGGVQSATKSASSYLLTASHGMNPSSNSANTSTHLVILPVAIGLWNMALSRYDDITEML